MLITTEVTPLLCNTNQHYAVYERGLVVTMMFLFLCLNVWRRIARSKEELVFGDVACLKDTHICYEAVLSDDNDEAL